MARVDGLQSRLQFNQEGMGGGGLHLGFVLEGVLRGFMPAGSGPPRDYAMYGLTKADVDRRS